MSQAVSGKGQRLIAGMNASGIEPTRKILDIASENENVDFTLVLAKILRELTAQTGNIT